MGRQVLSESLLGPQVQPRTPSGVSGPGFQLSRPRARGPEAGPESDVLSLAAPASPRLAKPWLCSFPYGTPQHTLTRSLFRYFSLLPCLRLWPPSWAWGSLPALRVPTGLPNAAAPR